jgi:paraquat-inducible protein A
VSVSTSPHQLKACHCCGLVHAVAHLAAGEAAYCVRCHSKIHAANRHGGRSSARCFAAALGALILYFPAILLPILEIEKLGHHHTSSLLGGTLDLLWHGNWFVGSIVLACSIVLPLLKLLALLELSYIGVTHRRHRAWTYRLVEWTGRWSMMDVLLLALLVTLIKLGELVSFHLGPAVIAFIMCVVMSIIASIMFDPHAIWDDGDSRSIGASDPSSSVQVQNRP